MSVKLKYLKDGKTGSRYYPITHSTAVVTSNGGTVQNQLDIHTQELNTVKNDIADIELDNEKLQNSVKNLTELQGAKFIGIYTYAMESNGDESAISYYNSLVENNTIANGDICWYLVGESLEHLNLHYYDGNEVKRYNNTEYDFTSFEDLKNEVDKVKNVIGELIEIPITQKGYYISTNLAIGSTISMTPQRSSSSPKFNYSIQEVSQDDIVIINGSGGSSPRLWAFITSDNVLIDAAKAGDSSDNNELVKEVPENAAYVIINSNNDLKSYISKKNTLINSKLDKKDFEIEKQRIDNEILNTNNTITKKAGSYEENPEFIYLITDLNKGVLFGIKRDGDIYFGKGIPSQINSLIKENSIDSDEYSYIFVDSNDNIISAVRKDGAIIDYTKHIFGGKLILNDGADISTIEKIESFISSLTLASSYFTNDGTIKEVKSGGITIYPITKDESVYNDEGLNLSERLNQIIENVANKINNEIGSVSWDNLSSTVQSIIISGGGSSEGTEGISFIPADGDLEFININGATKLRLYTKLPSNSKGIKYDYQDTDIDSFFDKENTIYVIRYKHITETPIEIPNSCELNFNGGSILADITFNNTYLRGDVNIVGSTLHGKISNKEFNSSWICYKDGATDDVPTIESMIEVCDNIILESGVYNLISSRKYYEFESINCHIHINRSNISIKGHGNPVLKTAAHVRAINVFSKMEDRETLIESTKNISIEGITIKCIHDGTFVEFAHSIALFYVENVIIKDCIFYDYFGDAICLTWFGHSSVNKNITIENNKIISISNNNRNGVSVISGDTVSIINNVFDGGTKSGMPGHIDIEPTHKEHKAHNIRVIGNVFKNLSHGRSVAAYIPKKSIMDKVIISNNIIENGQTGIRISNGTSDKFGYIKNLIIEGNICYNNKKDFSVTVHKDGELLCAENVIINGNIFNNFYPAYDAETAKLKNTSNLSTISKLKFVNNVTASEDDEVNDFIEDEIQDSDKE